MIRTQVYLSKKQYDDIKLSAEIEGRPSAQIIRELIDEGLKAKQSKKRQLRSWAKLSEELNITGGPKDLARNIDKYLYEDA